MSKVIKKAYAEEMLGVFESGNETGLQFKNSHGRSIQMSSLP